MRAHQMFADDGSSQEPNYNNQLVAEICEKLGPFQYGAAPNDGQPREKRELTTLENGARYEGEWNTSTN